MDRSEIPYRRLRNNTQLAPVSVHCLLPLMQLEYPIFIFKKYSHVPFSHNYTNCFVPRDASPCPQVLRLCPCSFLSLAVHTWGEPGNKGNYKSRPSNSLNFSKPPASNVDKECYRTRVMQNNKSFLIFEFELHPSGSKTMDH